MNGNTPRWREAAGIIISACLLAGYARGGAAFALGFVALVPWLASLGTQRGVWSTLLNAWCMSIAFALAAFWWFAFAVAGYLGIAPVWALLALVLLAPLLQPQVIVFALVRRWAAGRHGWVLAGCAAAAAWIACEWLWPKLLGDTLGHGLHPSLLLRQFADVAGAAGLSFVLLLVNQALAVAFARRRDGKRAWVPPLALAAALPLLLAGYGSARLAMLRHDDGPAPPLRIGMVQTGIVDYERLRAQMGAGEVVRMVLDAHFAQSWPMARSGDIDALLWSETVYPTTYGNPKSEAGAKFDAEIAQFVRAAGVPLVFGAYERDAAGEYNAAAFADPDAPLLGFYRKTRLFFATEYLPRWMEALGMRTVLPWAGDWQRGSGARVMPLRLADGREIPVQALICLDDVDARLAIDGARLGAQALLGMSNDSWFTRQPIGARLHLQVAAFRSIETRLPQARVTSNGLSAVIDANGGIVAQTAMGEPAVLVGALALRDPPITLMRMLGDWAGATALGLLVLLAVVELRRAWRWRFAAPVRQRETSLPGALMVLSPARRGLVAALQLFARAAVLALAWAWWMDLAGQGRLLTQLRSFAMLVLAPELLAWVLARWHRAKVVATDGVLAMYRRGRADALRGSDVARMQAWRLPLPADGVTLRTTGGATLALAGADAPALARALGVTIEDDAGSAAAALHRQRARQPWLQHPFLKFGLFPLLPALVAFRLHQVITFGGTFGEALTFGWAAWFTALGLWWARWIVNLVLLAGVLRVAIEVALAACSMLAPSRAGAARTALESFARWAYYLGVPAWLLWRVGIG